MKKHIVSFALGAFVLVGITVYAKPGVSEPQSSSAGIRVSWWATDAAANPWGVVKEVPRIGDYIRGDQSEQSYRQVLKAATLSDGTIHLRVGPPGDFR
ncbi:MAG: hypothetical protein WAO58_13010 [Fimbriimonadaceae bacterium]